MTLIDTYESIVQFMLATMRTLGREHPQIAPMQSAQVKHLVAIIRNRSTEVEQIRSLITQVADDTSGAFQNSQRELLTTVLVDAASGHAEEVSTDGMQGGLRQQHMYSYNYYTDSTWTELCDRTKPLQRKMRVVSQAWLGFGLVYPSEPTMRIGLSTVFVASGIELNSVQAKEKLDDFKNIFRGVRSNKRFEATLKQFPEDANNFWTMYPSKYTEADPPVKCLYDTSDINLGAHKTLIPCRTGNKALGLNGAGQARKAPSEGSGANQVNTMLAGLVRFALQGRGQHDDDEETPGVAHLLPPRFKRRDSPITRHSREDGTTETTLAAADAADARSAEASTPLGVGAGAQTGANSAAEGAGETAEARQEKRDRQAALVLGLLGKRHSGSTGTGVKAKPAAAEASAKAATELASVYAAMAGASDMGPEEPDSERDGATDADDVASVSDSPSHEPKKPAAARRATALPVAGAALKRPAAASPAAAKAAPPAKKTKAATPVLPNAVTKLFPPMATKNSTVMFAGGKIYMCKDRFRAAIRVGDKHSHEKSFVFGEGASNVKKQEFWERACAAIVTDPRPAK